MLLKKFLPLTMLISVLSIAIPVSAQNDPNCDPDCPFVPGCPPECIPFDSGLGLLLAAGIAVGAWKSQKSKSKSQKVVRFGIE